MAFDEKTKTKVIALISALYPKAKLYLFGSRARGTAAEFSDVDLAIDNGERMDMLDVAELNYLMEALVTPYKIEIVDIHAISPEMHNEIQRDKIIWKA